MKPAHHPAFEQLSHRHIPSLNVEFSEYRHRITGATHIHIHADNNENVFLVALRTVPHDSTGVAHILEHTALCGSEKYPVRDPFFLMTRRSLNTFMNAFTSSDWTAYPFASQNRKDFDNLLDVYLDAVFFARLDPLDFAQEGHRLEFAEADNPDSPLMYKGVVFNEMKGAMSSVVSRLWQSLSSYLFPTSTYHHNSGGEPSCIPDLSYEQLVSFYKTHYHPSNAIFMTYGDITAAEHQARFETQVLSRFERLEHTIQVSDEKRLLAPLTVEEFYPLNEDDQTGDKTHVVISWLLGKSADLQSNLEAQLLAAVLFDNASSPLQQALESSHLGTSPSPLCGLEDSQKELVFAAGLEGCAIDAGAQVEYLVLDTLKQVAERGVPAEAVEACLHQLELQQREIGGDGYPYGLQLILQSLSSATHRGDPVALLDLEPALAALRQRAQQPDFIKALVKRLLLENQHRVTLSLKPDPQLATRQEQAERQQLDNIRADLSQDQCQQIIEQAQALEARQSAPMDSDILPKVTLADVPASMLIPQPEAQFQQPVPLTRYAAGTNGLIYQQLIVPLPPLSSEELALLPLLGASLTEVGCGTLDYLQTQHRQSAISGGISAFPSMRSAVENSEHSLGYFVLSTKALARNHAESAALLADTWHNARFDEHRRLRELVSQIRTRRERSLTSNGHSLMMAAAASGYSPLASYQHRVTGIGGVAAMKQLDKRLGDEHGLTQYASQLQQLHTKLLLQPVELLLIAESERLQPASDSFSALFAAHTQTTMPFAIDYQPGYQQQLWQTSTQINYCARAWKTVALAHPDAAALTVLGGYLRNGFLHRAIREQGGAYGGGASQDSTLGVFRLYSYRDPRIEGTLADFDAALDWLASHTPSANAVEEAVLGVISSLDKPGSPAGEAKAAFHNRLFGRSDAVRQDFRARILAVSGSELQRVGAQYLLPANASTAVMTDANGAALAEKLKLALHKV